MSTVSYSTDLRKRVIVSRGNSQKSAAELFSISTTTVSTWWNIYNKEGRIAALLRGGRKGKVCKQALQKFVHRHPDNTLKQLGEHLGVTA
ncbi:MAG: helix-turn-helix domain containing protein [Cytophagales bacterium]|nr:helix-turn-helix domain containing protein [Cytophagales bacterium]